MATAVHRAIWTPTLGAVAADGGVTFSVSAPAAARVDLCLERGSTTLIRALVRDRQGVFSGRERDVRPGTRYWFSVDGGRPLPDPASRSQPEGVHGPSAFVDPSGFRWTDQTWPGASLDRLVIYELHVGTFSPEGTFAGVEAK